MSNTGKTSQSFNQAKTQTVTKGERDALIAARPKPKVEQHHTPGGTIESTVKQTLNARNEARIDRIQNRLDTAQSNMRFAHKKALVRGRAKTGFERCR